MTIDNPKKPWGIVSSGLPDWVTTFNWFGPTHHPSAAGHPVTNAPDTDMLPTEKPQEAPSDRLARQFSAVKQTLRLEGDAAVRQKRKSVLSNVIELRLCGGGAKGAYSFPGAYKHMVQEAGLDPQKVTVLTGISVGSLLCTALALGFEPDELANTMLRLDGQRLKDSTWRSSLGFIGNILTSVGLRFMHGYIKPIFGYLLRGIGGLLGFVAHLIGDGEDSSWGLLEGHQMRRFLTAMFQERMDNPNPTFKELTRWVEETQHRRIRLRFVTSQICCSVEKVWDNVSTPDAKIVDVLLASLGVPAAFQPLRDGGHFHADGGIKSNVPPSLADVPLEQTLCVHFYDSEEHGLVENGVTHRPIHNVLDFFWNIFSYGYFLATGAVPKEEAHRSLPIVVTAVTSADFGAPAEKRMQASEEGRASAEQYTWRLAQRALNNEASDKEKSNMNYLTTLLRKKICSDYQIGPRALTIGFKSQHIRDKVVRDLNRRRLEGVTSIQTADRARSSNLTLTTDQHGVHHLHEGGRMKAVTSLDQHLNHAAEYSLSIQWDEQHQHNVKIGGML